MSWHKSKSSWMHKINSYQFVLQKKGKEQRSAGLGCLSFQPGLSLWLSASQSQLRNIESKLYRQISVLHLELRASLHFFFFRRKETGVDSFDMLTVLWMFNTLQNVNFVYIGKFRKEFIGSEHMAICNLNTFQLLWDLYFAFHNQLWSRQYYLKTIMIFCKWILIPNHRTVKRRKIGVQNVIGPV